MAAAAAGCKCGIDQRYMGTYGGPYGRMSGECSKRRQHPLLIT